MRFNTRKRYGYYDEYIKNSITYYILDLNKYCILELGVLDPIKRILTSDEIRNNELKYWTLMILYQISLSGKEKEII